MISRFKSAKTIIAGLYRDLNINTEISEQNCIEWIGEALALIGAYPQYKEQGVVLDVDNHRANLPCDYIYLKDITDKDGRPLSWSTKSIYNNYDCPECKIPKCCTEHNFYISDNIIHTSMTNGQICMVYTAMPVDEDNFPMIPDDVYYDKALKAYVTFMMDKIQWRKGVLPEAVFRESQRDWYWYVNSSRASAYMPDAAAMERLKNIWVRLMPLQSERQNNFANLERPERRTLN